MHSCLNKYLTKQFVQELKDCNANCDQCQNCIYKQFFYENTQNVEIPKSTLSQENVEKTINVEFLNTQQTESEIKNVDMGTLEKILMENVKKLYPKIEL